MIRPEPAGFECVADTCHPITVARPRCWIFNLVRRPLATIMAAIPLSSAALEDEVARTKILLLGQRRYFLPSETTLPCMLNVTIHVHRSGKTSIQQILFNDADPKQTFYFEPTIRIMKHKHEYALSAQIVTRTLTKCPQTCCGALTRNNTAPSSPLRYGTVLGISLSILSELLCPHLL